MELIYKEIGELKKEAFFWRNKALCFRFLLVLTEYLEKSVVPWDQMCLGNPKAGDTFYPGLFLHIALDIFLDIFPQ